jgi:hypothetical protein
MRIMGMMIHTLLWISWTIVTYCAGIGSGAWFVGSRIRRARSIHYVLAARAKVVPFNPEEFDAIAQAYKASPERRSQVIKALYDGEEQW